MKIYAFRRPTSRIASPPLHSDQVSVYHGVVIKEEVRRNTIHDHQQHLAFNSASTTELRVSSRTLVLSRKLAQALSRVSSVEVKNAVISLPYHIPPCFDIIAFRSLPGYTDGDWSDDIALSLARFAPHRAGALPDVVCVTPPSCDLTTPRSDATRLKVMGRNPEGWRDCEHWISLETLAAHGVIGQSTWFCTEEAFRVLEPHIPPLFMLWQEFSV